MLYERTSDVKADTCRHLFGVLRISLQDPITRFAPIRSAHVVYTFWVDDRPVVWDVANRKHLAEDHPERSISLEEVEEVLADPGRIELHLEKRQAYQVVGTTSTGRWLVVIWIDQPEGRYPIHARAASKRIIRRLTQG